MLRLLLLLLFAISVSIHAQDAADTAILKDKILDLERKINNVSRKYAKEEQRDKAYRSRIVNVLEKRDVELLEIKSSFTLIETNRKNTKANILSMQRKSKNIDLRVKALKESISIIAEELKIQIENGFPASIKKRNSSLVLLIRDIKESAISLEEAMARLWVIMDNEDRFGSSIEVRKKEIILSSGVAISVNELRIGKQFLLYVSDNSKQYGVLKKFKVKGKDKFEWITDGFDFATRTAIRDAIGVKTGKKPPQLISIPFFISSKEGK